MIQEKEQRPHATGAPPTKQTDNQKVTDQHTSTPLEVPSVAKMTTHQHTTDGSCGWCTGHGWVPLCFDHDDCPPLLNRPGWDCPHDVGVTPCAASMPVADDDLSLWKILGAKPVPHAHCPACWAEATALAAQNGERPRSWARGCRRCRDLLTPEIRDTVAAWLAVIEQWQRDVQGMTLTDLRDVGRSDRVAAAVEGCAA